MSILYNRQEKKNAGGLKWRAVLFLVFMAAITNINIALAQHTNLSDWHVPPPLPPGNTTKGSVTGKDAKSNAIALIPADIPAPQLPKGPSVQLPQRASISTTALSVNIPEQPLISGGSAEKTPVPSPVAPDAPAMPQLQLQDGQTATADIPDPGAPELPAIPAEPLPAKTTHVATWLPVTPGVLDRVAIVFPVETGSGYFPTPGMPENSRENINIPPMTENDKKQIKPKKTRTKTIKNKPDQH